MAPKNNEFEQYQQAITLAAGSIYAAERDGQPLEAQSGDVSILPQDLGDGSHQALAEAKRAQARFNTAANVITTIALLEDDVDRGLPRSVFARIELGLSRLLDRSYLRDSQPIVDRIRGRSTEQ